MMTITSLTLASWTTGILTGVFLVFCVLFCLIILIQKPRGGGLSGAFGGGGGGAQAIMGARTGDFLTWITVSGFVFFLLMGIGLVYSTRADAYALKHPTAPTTNINTALPGTETPAGATAPGNAPAPAGTPANAPATHTTAPQTPSPAKTAPVIPGPGPAATGATPGK